nr:MAG TPA: hypothetical protein [Bacteriophage sp.]
MVLRHDSFLRVVPFSIACQGLDLLYLAGFLKGGDCAGKTDSQTAKVL